MNRATEATETGVPSLRYAVVRRLDSADRSARFTPLAEALGQLAAASAEGPTPAREVYLLCAEAGAESGKGQFKIRHEFFVDLYTGDSNGNGTEESPWDRWATVVDRLADAFRQGEVELGPGQAIRVVAREPFTATRHEHRRNRRECIVRAVLASMTAALVVPVAAILIYLFVRALPVFRWEFFFANPKEYMTAGGIWAPLVGTFFLVVFSLLAAAPIGVLAGVYLNEYARDNWWTRLVNLAVVNLAGVPSIVHALFGVGAFVLFAGLGRSLTAASLTLAVMTLPVIITSTREALASVPMSFREACWNMGATRWQTIRTIVLPNSISGILTGVILQVARAAGETAPILFTGAVFFVPVADHGWGAFVPYGPHDRCMALSMHLFTLATQVRGVSAEMQYGVAAVLIALVLAVNSMSIAVRGYLRSRKKW